MRSSSLTSIHLFAHTPSYPHTLTRHSIRMQAGVFLFNSSSLPAVQDVSIVRVNCLQLKEALVPAPTASLAQLHELLPALAANLFHVRAWGLQSGGTAFP